MRVVGRHQSNNVRVIEQAITIQRDYQKRKAKTDAVLAKMRAKT